MDMMMTSLLKGSLTWTVLLELVAAGLGLGLLNALIFRIKSRQSNGFTLALTLLPAAVAVVILLVNGNIGTGLAVAGAFALVRFRSMPGSARDIVAVFTSVAIGLALGVGYIGIGCLLVAAAAVAVGLSTIVGVCADHKVHKQLRITVSEDMDYNTLFDDIFAEHQLKAELVRIKSTAMGTLFELTYDVTMPSAQVPKALMDALRTRNSNLSIVFGAMPEDDTL